MKSPKNIAGAPRSGQMLIFVSLSLSTLLALIGLAVDLGYSYYIKTQAQAVADSAVQAAAVYATKNGFVCGTGITCGATYNCADPPTSPAVTPFEAGCLYAQINGFVNTGNQSVSFIANNTATPNESTYTPALWIQANVSQTVGHWFLFGSGFQSGSVAARAIAGVATTGGASCIIALSLSGTGFSDSGSGNITTSSCGIADNSSLSYTGSGNISAGTSISYIGTKTMSGSGTVTPAPTVAATPVTDPFASVPSPSVGACTNPNAGLSYPLVISDSASHTISPGTYCGGIQLSGSGNITFQSGTYVINGVDTAGKSFDYSGSGNLTGNGVMFFITGQNGYTVGPISVAGSGNLTFSALSSGTYEGILFYQDRTATYAASNTYSGSGNVTGTLYFATTSLSYSGSGNAEYQAIVANKITMTGSGNFTRDTTGTLTGLVRTVAAIIQ